MLNFRRVALLLSLSFIWLMPGVAQTLPCRPGTMADVLGSSCSVGPIIFNFQNDFSAQTQMFVQGIFSEQAISPSEIGFIPVQDDNHAGFKLVTNFTDGPNGENPFNEIHSLQFSYTPQAAPGFEIRVQGLSMDATAQGAAAGGAAIEVFDNQNYPNSGPLQTSTSIDMFSDQIEGINNRGEITGGFFDPNTFRSFTQRFQQSGSFNPLDVPGQGDTTSLGINDRGDIVGIYNDFNLVQHGFLNRGTGFRTVDFPGGNHTFAVGINAPGKIVGGYSDAAGVQHSFLATPAVERDGNDAIDSGSVSTIAATAAVQPNEKPVCGSEEWRRFKAHLRGSACRPKQ